VDVQKAKSRTAEAQLKQLTDMLQKDEASIQELTNELSDRREELNAANRKLHTLKESAEGGLSSQPSLPMPVTPPPPYPVLFTICGSCVAKLHRKTANRKPQTPK